MKRREAYPLQKVTLNLRAGDFDRLRILHGSKKGAGRVVRELVIGHLKRVDERMKLEVPLEARLEDL